MEWMRKGLEYADSFVFNPHKWLFTNFDCSAYFIRDKEALIRTFEILPEYLKTATRGQVNDYRDWGVPLGRRFRALKLWFVMRTYGLEGMRGVIRDHILMSKWLEERIREHPDFELLAPARLNMVIFRYKDGNRSEEQLNELNQQLLTKINDSGNAFITHTKVKGKYAIRLVSGQTRVKLKHVKKVWKMILNHINEW